MDGCNGTAGHVREVDAGYGLEEHGKGLARVFPLTKIKGAGKIAVWRAMEKMRDAAGRGQRESDGLRIFLLPGILLCAVLKCIAW